MTSATISDIVFPDTTRQLFSVSFCQRAFKSLSLLLSRQNFELEYTWQWMLRHLQFLNNETISQIPNDIIFWNDQLSLVCYHYNVVFLSCTNYIGEGFVIETDQSFIWCYFNETQFGTVLENIEFTNTLFPVWKNTVATNMNSELHHSIDILPFRTFHSNRFLCSTHIVSETRFKESLQHVTFNSKPSCIATIPSHYTIQNIPNVSRTNQHEYEVKQYEIFKTLETIPLPSSASELYKTTATQISNYLINLELQQLNWNLSTTQNIDAYFVIPYGSDVDFEGSIKVDFIAYKYYKDAQHCRQRMNMFSKTQFQIVKKTIDKDKFIVKQATYKTVVMYRIIV